MVWVWTLGDYTADDNPTWTNMEKLIRDQRLGGAIISVGGPADIAVRVHPDNPSGLSYPGYHIFRCRTP